MLEGDLAPASSGSCSMVAGFSWELKVLFEGAPPGAQVLFAVARYCMLFPLWPTVLGAAFSRTHHCSFPSSGFTFVPLSLPYLLQSFSSPFPPGCSPFFSLFSPGCPLWSSVDLFIHSFNGYTLSANCIPGPVLGTCLAYIQAQNRQSLPC